MPPVQQLDTDLFVSVVDSGDVSVDRQYSSGRSLLVAEQLRELAPPSAAGITQSAESRIEAQLPSSIGMTQSQEPSSSIPVTEVGQVPEVTCLADLIADLGEVED